VADPLERLGDVEQQFLGSAHAAIGVTNLDPQTSVTRQVRLVPRRRLGRSPGEPNEPLAQGFEACVFLLSGIAKGLQGGRRDPGLLTKLVNLGGRLGRLARDLAKSEGDSCPRSGRRKAPISPSGRTPVDGFL